MGEGVRQAGGGSRREEITEEEREGEEEEMARFKEDLEVKIEMGQGPPRLRKRWSSRE
jgi:hypothetical protein